MYIQLLCTVYMCVSLESENKQCISISVRLSELISDDLIQCLGLRCARRLQHPCPLCVLLTESRNPSEVADHSLYVHPVSVEYRSMYVLIAKLCRVPPPYIFIHPGKHGDLMLRCIPCSLLSYMYNSIIRYRTVLPSKSSFS